MVNCEECGKKLRFLEGYRHPTLGRKHLVCTSCFDRVSESVENWMEFVISYSPKYESSRGILKFGGKNVPVSFTQKSKMFDDFLMKNEIYMK